MSVEQTSFLMPIGMSLNPNNRWVRLSKLVPWSVAASAYESHFEGRKGGPRPLSVRVALGALIIKERLGLTDRETVEQIRENPYLQYFIGKSAFTDDVPFDHSRMAVFRRRFGDEIINTVNETLVEQCIQRSELKATCDDNSSDDDGGPGQRGATGVTGPVDPTDDAPREPSGRLLIDATCAPADITYPTDLKLLDHARRLSETIIDVLHEPYIGLRSKPRTYRKNGRRDFLRAAKKKKLSRRKRRTAIGTQLRYLRRDLDHIKAFVDRDPDCLLLLNEELYRKLLVIHEVYRQQEYLYRTKERRIDDRILNITQPHVRPIVRGKVHAHTEFGAKISASSYHGYATLDKLSWDAYHEASDLPEQAEAYRSRCGCYPEVICADRIYRTRANRNWCKERGIRLSGMPPGRPLGNPQEQRELEKQVRNDESARQPVEGVFGCGKRRYGLARIMSKTAITSACSIALVFLVLNLEVALTSFCLVFLLAMVASAVFLYPSIVGRTHRLICSATGSPRPGNRWWLPCGVAR